MATHSSVYLLKSGRHTSGVTSFHSWLFPLSRTQKPQHNYIHTQNATAVCSRRDHLSLIYSFLTVNCKTCIFIRHNPTMHSYFLPVINELYAKYEWNIWRKRTKNALLTSYGAFFSVIETLSRSVKGNMTQIRVENGLRPTTAQKWDYASGMLYNRCRIIRFRNALPSSSEPDGPDALSVFLETVLSITSM